MGNIIGPAGQGDLTGSLLEGDLRFDLSETFAAQSGGAYATDSLAVPSKVSAGGNAGAADGSLAGTTVQMGAAGGLVFNVTWDSSVSNAPAGFTSAIGAVVNYYTSVFNDPVTVNIDVGWGEVAGQALASGALAESETNLGIFTYSQVRAALAGDAKSPDDTMAVASLPASDPTGASGFVIATAEARALGLAANAAVDGYVGFSSGASYTFDPTSGVLPGTYDFMGVAEHEISEVIGRIALLGTPLGSGSLSHTYTALDLFRYSNPGIRQLAAGNPAYFSPDGGTTHLNNFNTVSSGDAGDWASGGGNDSYNAFVSSGVAEPVSANDLREMDVIGWDRTGAKTDTPAVVTPVSANIAAANGQTFGAAALFTASDPDGDTITQYDLEDTGNGGGHFILNGAAQPANKEIVITAAQLAQVTYQAGTAADTLSVRANDGAQWGAWASFTVTGPPPNNTPAVVMPFNANVPATNGQVIAATSLFTASDPDGDGITQYDLRDTGTGGGRFVVDGVVKSANRDIVVSAAQLAQVTYRAGKGTDALSVRANDGSQWGPWSNFTVTGGASSHTSSFAASSGDDGRQLGWDNWGGVSGHEAAFLTYW